MATYRYSGQPVVANDDIVENATGGTFVDANGATIPIYDLNDNPITTITSNAFGMSSNFKADVPMGYIKFGSNLNRVFADEVAQFAVDAGALESRVEALEAGGGGGGGGGVTVHGLLSGLSADDHQQYFNQARGDARYYTKTQVDANTAAAFSTNSSGDRQRSNHTGTQAQSTIDNLVSALTGRAQTVLVTTGAEVRPAGSTIVMWVCPTGLTPANAAATDLVFSPTSGSSPADTTAPTIPSGLAASGITSSAATISWTASTDAVGVTAYEVFANSVSKGTSATTSKALTDLAASTNYSIQVRARDAAGNWSALSAPLSVTTSGSGTTVKHSVFAATAHPTLAKFTDGPLVAGTAFYTSTSAANGWRVRGMRLYVPTGITVPSSATCYLWGPSTAYRPQATSEALRTVTMGSIVAGQWNEVEFSSPLTVTPGTPFWLGYAFPSSDYLAISAASFDAALGASGAAKQSNNTPYLYLAETALVVSQGTGRSFFLQGGGSAGSNNGWGIDAIIDEGS